MIMRLFLTQGALYHYKEVTSGTGGPWIEVSCHNQGFFNIFYFLVIEILF